MAVNNIDHFVMTGRDNPKSRVRIFNEFTKSKSEEKRVLVMSKVGSTGLNATCVEDVIFYVSEKIMCHLHD